MYYFDFRFPDGSKASYYRVVNFVFSKDRKFIKLYCLNGWRVAFNMDDVSYIGMGDMEDFDSGIHLPFTIYM